MAVEKPIVLFVPLHEEMQYIDARIGGLGFEAFPSRSRYDRTRHRHVYRGIAADRRGFWLNFQVLDAADRDVMGNIATAASVVAALGLQRAHVAILIGLAGSLHPDEVRLGDVVLADSAKFLFPDKLRPIDHGREIFVAHDGPMKSEDGRLLVDSRKRFLGDSFFRFRRDTVHNSNSTELLAAYLEYARSHPVPGLEAAPSPAAGMPQLHFGAILGSDWVVDSEDYVQFLLDRDRDDRIDWYRQRAAQGAEHLAEADRRNRWGAERLLAVDMESYGFFKAVETCRGEGQTIQAFVVRGISDLARGKSALDRDTKGAERTRAVRNAATVALDLVARLTEWSMVRRG